VERHSQRGVQRRGKGEKDDGIGQRRACTAVTSESGQRSDHCLEIPVLILPLQHLGLSGVAKVNQSSHALGIDCHVRRPHITMYPAHAVYGRQDAKKTPTGTVKHLSRSPHSPPVRSAYSGVMRPPRLSSESPTSVVTSTSASSSRSL
jgi:hypothetical protein